MGGQDDAFEAALPVIKAMSRYVFRMGGPGTGHIAKTLNNYVSAANVHILTRYSGLCADTPFC